MVLKSHTSDCENLTDSGFELLPSCKSLATLICKGTFISNHGAEMVGQIRKIQTINFSECQRIVDWEKIMRKISPEIDSIDFSIIKSLTNNGVKELAFNCRQISSINLAGCIELNDLAIQYISGVCRHLKYINISGLPHISKRSIRFLKKVSHTHECTGVYMCANVYICAQMCRFKLPF